MERLVVRPSGPLTGSVPISGAKNSVLKLMAASLLADGNHVLRGVPAITDVATMSDLLRAMGVATMIDPDDSSVLHLHRGSAVIPEAPYELVERIRASIVVLGPLLARCGRARVSLPGGDDFGPRPIDMHLAGLEALGARFRLRHGYLEGEADDGLKGTEVALDFPSVGATENIVMAAVLAKGTTVLDNAAREPEIQDLCHFLVAMGARISGIGSPTLVVQGVTAGDLQAVDHTVVPDRIEAATYLAAVGVAGGEIELVGARADHMDMLLRKLREMGMRVTDTGTGLLACVDGRLRPVDVATLPYPGVATDYKPFLTAMLTVADGVGIVTENLFSGRFRYIDELVRMGADIRTDRHHVVVRGVPRLSGAPVRAHDIRAGAAMLVAGLAADGETTILDAHHLERGYGHLEAKLRGLGVDVEVS